jgi:hypothetical protein
MTIRSQAAALFALTLFCTGMVRRAEAQEPEPPLFRVQIWGDAAAVFGAQIRSYASLREELERELPPLQVTDDVAALLGRTRALAEHVRQARARAKPGDIFTPEVRQAFTKALRGHADAATCAAVLDENPGTLAVPINGRYPTHEPLSTMPPDVLATLPPLPVDIEYRFAGRDLMLFDTRAGIVIDRMRSDFPCRK